MQFRINTLWKSRSQLLTWISLACLNFTSYTKIKIYRLNFLRPTHLSNNKIRYCIIAFWILCIKLYALNSGNFFQFFNDFLSKIKVIVYLLFNIKEVITLYMVILDTSFLINICETDDTDFLKTNVLNRHIFCKPINKLIS
jgi:hypothetical protein